MNSVIIRYDEIGLKGHNRPYFEKLLAVNIKECLRKQGIAFERVQRFRGRMILITDEADKAILPLQKVFGIASLSPAVRIGHDFEQLKAEALRLAVPGKSFRITTKRLSKKFPMDSNQISQELGGYVQEQTGAKVELVKPDITIGVDVLEDSIFIFSQSVQGARGLPVGCEGKVLGIITEDRNSMVACWLMLKRGCKLVLVSDKSQDLGRLPEWSIGQDLKLYQRNEPHADAKELMEKEGCLAMFDGIKSLAENTSSPHIFRPLEGFTEQEITDICKRI